MVVCSIRLRISWAAVIEKALLQLMDARTFVRNQVGIKTGYTEDVRRVGVDRGPSPVGEWARTYVYL